MPHRIQLLRHGARPFLDLAHLNRDIGIAGAAFVFRYQALSADNCVSDERGGKENGGIA